MNEELARDYGTTLTMRIGVNTGEVVTGTAERLATGDAVERRRAAGAGRAAGRDPARRGRPFGSCAAPSRSSRSSRRRLKGKASRCRRTGSLAVSRRGAAAPPRARRSSAVSASSAPAPTRCERARDERACHLFTVLGTAGVGKSRLVAEFLSAAASRDRRARPLPLLRRGHHVLARRRDPQAAARHDAGAARARPRRGRRGARCGCSGRPSGRLGARRSPGRCASCSRRSPATAARRRPRRPAVGRADVPRPRRARRRPLPRRADPAALPRPSGAARAAAGLGRRQAERDHGAARAARRRRGRAADRRAARDAPLDDDVARPDPGGRRRATRSSSRRCSRCVRERGDGEVEVPPTIQALLAARLDQLDPAERACSSAARSRARCSTAAPSQALAPDEPDGSTRLARARAQGARPARRDRSSPATTRSASATS